MTTSLVTSRIKSNAAVHGYQFAVDQEVRRFRRRGLAHKTAVAAALALFSSAMRHGR